MNYKHLSIDARSCIRKYYVEGLSYRKIAQLIGHSPSTVSREIRRNCTHMYDIPYRRQQERNRNLRVAGCRQESCYLCRDTLQCKCRRKK